MPWFYYLMACGLLGLLIYKKKRISLVLALTYMFLVFASTVLARTAGEKAGSDWTPFRLFTVEKWWVRRDMIQQILANILMFFPLGLLLSLSTGWWSILIGFAFSLIIELSQLVFCCGFSELDDVVHNTIGAGIGAAFYYFIHRSIVNKRT